MHLGGAVGEAHVERLEHHRGERHLVGDAERAVELQRPRRDVVEHLRHRRLHRRDVAAHLLVVVVAGRSSRPCAARGAGTARARSTSRRSSPGRAACGPAARPASIARAPARTSGRAPGGRARRCAWRGGCARRRGGSGRRRSRRRGRRGGGRRGCARRGSGRSCACPRPLGGRRRRRCGRSRCRACRTGTTNIESRRWRCLVGIGDGEHDQERREVGVRREPLLAVDHPLVAVEHGRGREAGRIGSAARLGHRVGRHDLVAQQRLEVPLP